jgi:transposase
MRFIGVDLHQYSLTVCYLNEDESSSLATFKLSQIQGFQQQLCKSDEVAVEATGNTRFFVNQIAALVARVVVVNPSQFEVITKSTSKTDKHDAQALARFLSKGLLPEARMKDEQTAQISSLCQTRVKLVKLRTTLFNKLHGLENAHGRKAARESFSSETRLAKMLKQEWEAIERVEVEVIVTQVRSLNQGIKRLDEEIKSAGKKMEGHDSLTSIKGIGEKSATILLSVIGPVEDFASAERLASYFGLVPRVSNSNETVHHGAITKRGSKLGRTTLVQCTWVAIRYSPYLKSFYEKLKARKGAGKAIIATARKLLGIIYRTLKNKWVFADFPNFVLAED